MTMIERLAKKHVQAGHGPQWVDHMDLAEARWWVHAIADEMEENAFAMGIKYAWVWLREEDE